MLVPDNDTPSFEGLNPFINTGKGVSILLKGSEKSMVDFGCICSLVPEELHVKVFSVKDQNPEESEVGEYRT
jgi:hypothetical protein